MAQPDLRQGHIVEKCSIL